MAGVGTGGTITGVGEALKERKPGLQVVAVEPEDSPVISQTKAGRSCSRARTRSRASGPGFIPENLNVDVVDEVIRTTNEEAFETRVGSAGRTA